MQRPPQPVLLTGATGYLGKHLLARLLHCGHPVTAIVRPYRGQLRQRVLDALASVSPMDRGSDHLRVVAGDVAQADCGLDAFSLRELIGQAPTALVHCAGLTRFNQHLREKIFLTNLEGTRNAWNLARKIAAHSFHHISTAYVAGDTRQRFGRASLDLGQGFHNPYEASKFAAERYLQTAPDQEKIPQHIYRPSIIVGGNPLGEGNAASTVYSFLKALHFLRECSRRDMQRGRGRFAGEGVSCDNGIFTIPLRFVANPNTPANLVAIDAVVDTVLERLHATPRTRTVVPVLGCNVCIKELADAFSAAAGLRGLQLVGKEAFQSRAANRIEDYFARSTRVYSPYLASAPDFEPADLGQCRVDPVAMARAFIQRLDAQQAQRPSSLQKLALDSLAVDTPSDYLHRFVNDRLGDGFLHKIPFVEARIRFCIGGRDASETTLNIHHGKVDQEPPDGSAGAAADCCYRMDDALFRAIINGETDMKAAFFKGQVSIEGNKEIGLKFAFLLDQHLQHIDQRIIEQIAG